MITRACMPKLLSKTGTDCTVSKVYNKQKIYIKKTVGTKQNTKTSNYVMGWRWTKENKNNDAYYFNFRNIVLWVWMWGPS